MGGASREGKLLHTPPISTRAHPITPLRIGGKVKPLKSAKKEKKDFDDEDLAFKEKQRAGELLESDTCFCPFLNDRMLIPFAHN